MEAYAVLIAFRLWAELWKEHRATIYVRSDSVSALIMLMEAKAKGAGTNIVAREIALDIAELNYRPNVARHISGISNKTADALSRMGKPDALRTSSDPPKKIPEWLEKVDRSRLQQRGRHIFRTI